jgi:hypothetical protein
MLMRMSRGPKLASWPTDTTFMVAQTIGRLSEPRLCPSLWQSASFLIGAGHRLRRISPTTNTHLQAQQHRHHPAPLKTPQEICASFPCTYTSCHTAQKTREIQQYLRFFLDCKPPTSPSNFTLVRNSVVVKLRTRRPFRSPALTRCAPLPNGRTLSCYSMQLS